MPLTPSIQNKSPLGLEELTAKLISNDQYLYQLACQRLPNVLFRGIRVQPNFYSTGLETQAKVLEQRMAVRDAMRDLMGSDDPESLD